MRQTIGGVPHASLFSTSLIEVWPRVQMPFEKVQCRETGKGPNQGHIFWFPDFSRCSLLFLLHDGHQDYFFNMTCATNTLRRNKIKRQRESKFGCTVANLGTCPKIGLETVYIAEETLCRKNDNYI